MCSGLHTQMLVWDLYGVISGPYFPVFGLNTVIYGVNLRIQPNTGKYGTEVTPYLDTFYVVILSPFCLLKIETLV